nr:13258_t:CDS:2 [Entrophospora candida]
METTLSDDLVNVPFARISKTVVKISDFEERSFKNYAQLHFGSPSLPSSSNSKKLSYNDKKYYEGKLNKKYGKMQHKMEEMANESKKNVIAAAVAATINQQHSHISKYIPKWNKNINVLRTNKRCLSSSNSSNIGGGGDRLYTNQSPIRDYMMRSAQQKTNPNNDFIFVMTPPPFNPFDHCDNIDNNSNLNYPVKQSESLSLTLGNPIDSTKTDKQ